MTAARKKIDPYPVGTELQLTIPMTISKNATHRAVPVRVRSKKTGKTIISARSLLSLKSRKFREFVVVLCMEQRMPRNISYGRWGVEIVAYWPTQRHLDVSFPRGDIDAPITASLDAICKGAHVFDDDVRIAPLTADREYDPDNPRIEVTFKRWQ